MSDAPTTTPAAPATNPWKANRRALKAQRLTDALDYAFDLARVTLQEARYEAVAGLDDAGWASAAAVACVNLPSQETRDIVLDAFRRRVRASVDAQIAAAIAGALKAVG